MADIVERRSPRIFVDPDAEPLGRSIAFVGAKGGVGASTIAHNVAWAMSTLFETEVVIADMDLPFGTANINFDQDPAQGIAEAVFSPERIDEVYLDRLLAKCAEHLSLLAAPSMLDRVYDFDADAFSQIIDIAQRSAPLRRARRAACLERLDPATRCAQADEIVIVAAPDLANLRNTKNLVDTLRKLRPNDAPPKLILNQVGMPKRPEIAVADFAEPLGLEPIAVIPFDPQLFGNAANNGRMLARDGRAARDRPALNDSPMCVTGRGEVKGRKKPGLSVPARQAEAQK